MNSLLLLEGEEAAENSGFDFSAMWSKLIELGTSFGMKLLGALIVLIIGGLIVRFIVRRLRKGRLLRHMESTVAHFLVNLIRIILNILLFLAVVSILGVPMTSFVALLTSAGVTIGLALQGAFSNLAGGIMILIFKPFKIGDYVSTMGLEGTVTDIGIFYTFLDTVDNKQVIIPNGSVMNTSIVNLSVHDTRRVDFVFNVEYGTDVDKVKAMLIEEAKKHSLVLSDPEPFCRLTAQANSSLEFTLRVWVKKADYWQVNFDLKESVHNRFAEEHIKIPFNQLDVHVKND